MNRAKNAITCVLLASLVALVVYVILLVRRATAVVSALPATIQTVIREQGQATRDAALSAITDTRREALAEISRTRGDLLARVDRLTDISERSIADLSERADRHLATLNTTVALNLGRANDSIAGVAALGTALKPTVDHVNEASAVLLRRDALPAQLLGLTAAAKVTLGQTAQTMRSVQNATPAMLATWQRIGDDISGTANNLNRLTKPRWYDRLLGYGMNGVVIYRNLNPATNLTIKGAEFVSSRP